MILISSCSFCGQGFEPAWDCRILPCHHVYHFWCYVVHFGSSLKCVHKVVIKEPHPEWWKLSGLKLPATFEEGPIKHDFGPQGEQNK